MEVEISPGLNVILNNDKFTASITKSPKATGNVFIPRYAQHEGKKYSIKSISANSFYTNEIKELTFAEDSEMETFEKDAFYCTFLWKLQIPASLKNLDDGWNNYLKSLSNVEVSPKNKRFLWLNNSFLLGKSDPNSSTFDILHHAHHYIENALIPSQIKCMKSYSFLLHQKLKSIIFPEDSKLEVIEDEVFGNSPIEKLVLPLSVKKIGKIFRCTTNLNSIEISPKNKHFSLLDNKFLLMKSQPSNQVYDVFMFAPRNTQSVTIPSYIKIIFSQAFSHCKQLKSITFEPNSSIEEIEDSAFALAKGYEKIIFPPSLKILRRQSFSWAKDLKYVQFLGDSIKIESNTFMDSDKIEVISFTNATKVEFSDLYSMASISKKTIIEVRKDAETIGPGFSRVKDQIRFIEVEKPKVIEINDSDEKEKKSQKKGKSKKKKKRKKEDKNKGKEGKEKSKKISKDEKEKRHHHKSKDKYKKENDLILSHIRFLEKRLDQYEKVIPFSIQSSENIQNLDSEIDTEEIHTENKTIFIDQNDEKYHQIISKIGEGATSVAFKIFDKRTSLYMCKKVLKFDPNNSNFTEFQNIMKEFEVLTRIDHPCICKAIGINTSENATSLYQTEQQNQFQSLQEVGNNQQEITTIALFLEFLPYSLKILSSKNFLNNTLKVKIAVEVAFGMSFIHSAGMMHRDLKLENIMLNYAFEAKIIDFGLVSVTDPEGNGMSLTKGIGTLAYMSPEMQNEEEYNEKTDVYSYGVVLYALFTGDLPKQTMRDKLNNKPLKFPEESQSMSSFCIELVKNCMAFEAEKRPSFDDVIESMKSHNFEMASEIDVDVVMRRYRTLNRIRNSKMKNDNQK